MTQQLTTQAYFDQVLPWQKQAWQQLTGQFEKHKLPHGLLAAGQVGIGKRAFVWRLVAYLLCPNRSLAGACATCQSCHWLTAQTHPDLMVLPASAQLGDVYTGDGVGIDDIRQLHNYSQNKGQGVKVIVIDHVDKLNISAANALLKTLEEPRDGVFLILITDFVAQVLPTIKSRVQTLPLSIINHKHAMEYLCDFMPDKQAAMLLAISDGAVLQAKDIASADWFGKRKLWLQTFAALQSAMRSPSAASDYWQKALSLSDFLTLSLMMLAELRRVCLDLPCLHADLDTQAILGQLPLDWQTLEDLQAVCDDVKISMMQHVQEKLGFDRLMLAMAKPAIVH